MKRVVVLFLTLASQAESRELVLQAVGQADNQVVTSREVQLNRVIEKILNPPSKEKQKRSEWEVAASSITPQDVTNVLLEWVVFFEAQNFSVANLEEKELHGALIAIESFVKDWPYWQSLEANPLEVQEIIKRKLRAKKLIRFKTESTEAVVSDQEIKDYFEKNRIKFGSLSLSVFRENIRAFLARQNRDKHLREWFEALKNRYKVKVLNVFPGA